MFCGKVIVGDDGRFEKLAVIVGLENPLRRLDPLVGPLVTTLPVPLTRLSLPVT